MNISLSKLPWYGQVGAFVVIAVLGVGAFTYYYEMPARAEMAARQAQLTALHKDIEKGHETVKKLPEFKAQVADLEGQLSNLRNVLPEEKDAADLLRRMQTVATQANLTITSFKPAPVAIRQLHAEWPINLELTGTYHNLANFFDQLAHFSRIVNISSLTVKAREKGDTSVTIAANCVATTFVLLDKPQPDPKSNGKNGKPAAKGKTPAKKVA